MTDKELDNLQKIADKETASMTEAKLKEMEKRQGLAKYIIDYYTELKNDRSNWDNMWQELGEMFLPRKSTVYDYDSTTGERLVNLFDITGVVSAHELASSLHFTLTNPTVQFFEYSTGDLSLDQNANVSKYLQTITQIDHSLLNNSNFQTEAHEGYLDISSLGTLTMRLDEDDETVINCTCRPIFEFVCDEDHKGRVDTVGREKMYTGRQLLQKFGEEKIFNNSHLYGDQKMQMYCNIKKRLTDKFKVFEMFLPSKDLRRCGFKASSRPFSNVFVLEEGAVLLKTDGYHEQIYAVSRWSKSGDEVYGRGPGHIAMPAMLMLNELSRLIIQSGQLATKPPVLLPDDGTYGGFNIFPGAINWYRAGTRDEITAFNPNPRVDVADFIVDKLVLQIRQAFMLDKFQIPNNDRMTREEVLTRQNENLRFTSPILGRQEQEFLSVIITRLHSIAERRGLYPEPPEELAGKNLEVKYASQVSRVQKSALADNAGMFVGELIQISTATQKPEILDNVDWDKYVSYLAFARSAPSDILSSAQDKDAVRQDRADMMEDQMNMQATMAASQAAQSEAKAAKDIVQADQLTAASEI